MLNPLFSKALLASMRLSSALVEAASPSRMSNSNAAITAKQMRAQIADIEALLDDVERRLAAEDDVKWGAR